MDSDPEELYGKRKKKKLKCPNPLFEQWLTEWRDEAALKGWKSQFNYGKALATLKRFPLPLASGKECKMLKNFGDKTCKMLETKLAEHVALHGTTAPVSSTTTLSTSVASLSSSTVTSTNHIPSSSIASTSTASTTISAGVDSSDSDTTDNLVKARPPKKRRKSSGNTEYIPGYRTGPYAILLALYTNRQDANCKGYLTKTELIRLAQPLTDTSLTEPDPANAQRYTGWSSMSTLIKKNLVFKERSPAQFSLTEAGCNLAHRLQHVDRKSTFINQSDHLLTDATPTLPSLHQSNDTMDVESERRITDVSPPSEKDNRLRYWYITEDDQQVLRKDKAAVNIDDNFGLGFLIKVDYTKLIISGKKYSLDLTRPLGDAVYAYLADGDADETACPLDLIKSANNQNESTSLSVSSNKQKADSGASNPKKTSKSKTSAETISSGVTNSINSRTISSSSDNVLKKKTAVPDKIGVPENDRTDSLTRIPYIEIDSSSNSQSSLASSVTSTVSSLPVPEFVLRPGEFEVVLCIDNREFYGSTKSSSKILLPDLIKNNVLCDLRELHVGDLLWVARDKKSHNLGDDGRSKELVLDFIIERKRMDDLVGSMVDGRLQDQKFRLKRSGIKNAIFLIENYGSMQNFSIGEDRIKQSITNTQVIDGFTVKRVKDTKESVVYLTVMTRYLQSYYRNKTLHACSPDVVKELDKSYNINDKELYLMPFHNFNIGSIKSKALTIKEMFGKQLIQLHGMSADKAKAVIDNYPTPSHLMEAYDRCTSIKDKDAMLSGIKCGKLVRNLGIAQSRQISSLYCSQTLT